VAESAGLESARLYADLIDQEFQRQYTRRDRLDAKGQSLIGQTGTTLTLAAAVVAFLVSKDPLVVLKAPTSLLLGGALVLGLGVMVIGIHVSGNRTYHALGPGMLDQMAVRPQWADTEEEALQHICRIKRQVTRENDGRNKRLVLWARIGQWGQIATVAAFLVGLASLAHALA
jgi:hypothetical protein